MDEMDFVVNHCKVYVSVKLVRHFKDDYVPAIVQLVIRNAVSRSTVL